MIVKASGRSALILATGLLAFLASPAPAATGDDTATEAKSENPTAAPATSHRTFRHAAHHRRHYVHRKSHVIAMKADTDDKKAPATEVAAADNKVLPEIPLSVANANAQMLLAGVQLSAAAAIPAGTDIPATAFKNPANAGSNNETFLVAADQLNDVDKTLQESNPPAAPTGNSSPPTTASATTASATTASVTSDNTVWDQTSLIGKIFIGFGALLTMASAARMFIA
jgi:hypothetical protein